MQWIFNHDHKYSINQKNGLMDYRKLCIEYQKWRKRKYLSFESKVNFYQFDENDGYYKQNAF